MVHYIVSPFQSWKNAVYLSNGALHYFCFPQLAKYLVPKVAVDEKWNEKAKYIFTPFCWHHLSYVYAGIRKYFRQKIHLVCVQIVFLCQYKICNDFIVLTPLPKWRISAVTSQHDYLK